MSHDRILSREGYEKLTAELAQLKGPERARIAANIREAKSHGDLRENAMYHEAKLNQKRLESRISELERVLQTAQVADDGAGAEGVVHLGCRVRIKDLAWGEELTVEIVGAFEADPANDKISVASPLGSALLETVVGAEVEVITPGGALRYSVLHIESRA